ncbi:hypothetical protein [Ancylomarina sp.]|uniref:hypothetical protein n=1 Tax=Ancylomarina sp. TaxID=1970196 RepID=UPI003568C4D8
MKTPIIVIALSLISLSGMAQEMNQTKVDDRIERSILFGRVTLAGLNDTLCANWFKPEFKAYNLDTEILSELKEMDLTGLKMVLVLGTWCHDSHLQVPRMIKLLKSIEFPMSDLNLFAMDTNKKAPGIDVQAIDVKLVPSLIVYKGTKELGRIIESPKVSLEADLLEILK